MLTRLAQQSLAANKVDDALAWAKLNLENFPKSAPTLVALSQAHARKGDKAAALKDVEQALAIDPMNAGGQTAARPAERTGRGRCRSSPLRPHSTTKGAASRMGDGAHHHQQLLVYCCAPPVTPPRAGAGAAAGAPPRPAAGNVTFATSSLSGVYAIAHLQVDQRFPQLGLQPFHG